MADEHKTVILCFPADRPFVEESLGPVLNSRLFAAGEDNDASICISSADASTMDTCPNSWCKRSSVATLGPDRSKDRLCCNGQSRSQSRATSDQWKKSTQHKVPTLQVIERGFWERRALRSREAS